jgi:FlaA1/EpsC-like NDP-sugar epimerase
VAVGLPEPTAVAVLWALAMFGGGIALSLRLDHQSWAGVLALTFFIAMIIFAVYLARIRVYGEAELANAPIQSITPLLADFLYKRRVVEVLLDFCLIPLAYYSAYRLHFDSDALALNYMFFMRSLPVVLAAQLIALFVAGGYRGTWRFFGIMDAVVFAKSVALGTVLSILILLFAYHFEGYSRAVFVIYAALLLLMLVGSRASFRLVGEFVSRRHTVGRRCVIYGTSGASVSTIREAFAQQPLRIIGFVDDDPMQARTTVAGYAVIGGFDRLMALIDAGDVDCVVVNSHIADVEKLQRLDTACQTREISLVRLQLNLKPFHVAS